MAIPPTTNTRSLSRTAKEPLRSNLSTAKNKIAPTKPITNASMKTGSIANVVAGKRAKV
jgi:hypothetical protein